MNKIIDLIALQEFKNRNDDRYVDLINPKNILFDPLLTTATIPSSYSSTVTLLDGYPSKIIHIESTGNNFKGIRLYLGSTFNPPTAGTYKIKFKMRVKRNSSYAYQVPTLVYYTYLDSSLKGSGSGTAPITKTAETSWSAWKESYANMTFGQSAASINYIEIGVANKYDYEIKDIYIVNQDDDNNYGYSIFDYLKSPLGKTKLSIIGDSISDTDYEPFTKWATFLEMYDGYELDNVSVSGAGFFNPSNKGGTYDHQFYNQANLIATDSDIVIVFGGFNDLSKLLNGDVTIGSRDDTGVTTICGCINNTINNILTRNPNCHICFALPSPWQGANSMAEPTSDVFSIINSLKEICEYRSIPLLDMFHESGIRPWIADFRTEYMIDGTHPNEKGHKVFLYPKFRDFLSRENWKKM